MKQQNARQSVVVDLDFGAMSDIVRQCHAMSTASYRPTHASWQRLSHWSSILPRDDIVQSAVLRSHVVCLSVCLWRWWIRTT